MSLKNYEIRKIRKDCYIGGYKRMMAKGEHIKIINKNYLYTHNGVFIAFENTDRIEYLTEELSILEYFEVITKNHEMEQSNVIQNTM